MLMPLQTISYERQPERFDRLFDRQCSLRRPTSENGSRGKNRQLVLFDGRIDLSQNRRGVQIARRAY